MDKSAEATGHTPSISVVIPVYNAERYLDECLDSVLGATLPNIEVICIDDGSTDRSLEILRERQSSDSRITVLTQEHKYAGAARNAGVRAATGTYIHFLDADDFVDPSAYVLWYDIAQKHHADICECLYKCFEDSTGKIVSVPDYPSWEASASSRTLNMKSHPKSLIHGSVVPWNKLFLRTFLVDNDITFDNLICAEDRSFYFATIMVAKRIVRANNRWISHRVGVQTSLDGSSIRYEHFDVEFRSFERIWELTKELPDAQRRMVLDSCIADSLYYFHQIIDTPYEPTIRAKLFEYWRPWVPLLGDEIYESPWLHIYLDMVTGDLPDEYRKSVTRLGDLHFEELLFQKRKEWLTRGLLEGISRVWRPVKKLLAKVR